MSSVPSDLVEKLPSAHTLLLLGDAYMNIQEVSACWRRIEYLSSLLTLSNGNIVPCWLLLIDVCQTETALGYKTINIGYE